MKPASLLALPLVALLCLKATPAWADPSLLVSPTRVVFDGAKRTAALTLLNNGADSGTYRIFLVHYRMTDTGAFEETQDPSPDDRHFDDMIRFTPKQVVLPPHQSQVVRLQLRLPADLPAGEYRTHLLFRVLPTVPAAGQPGGNGISIHLLPAVGVSIPLILRQGNTYASASLSALTLVPPSSAPDDPAHGKPKLGLRLERAGNRSLYGNLVATFKPTGGSAREVGRANGVAVYTPNTFRRALLPLEGALDTFKHGTLAIDYVASEADGKTLAHAELALP